MQDNDLISREAIIREIERIRKSTKTLTGIDFLWMIETFPAVDAAPVVHGRWVHHKGGYSDHYECTVCGEGIVLTARFRYCSNCGAKMDGDENAVD